VAGSWQNLNAPGVVKAGIEGKLTRKKMINHQGGEGDYVGC